MHLDIGQFGQNVRHIFQCRPVHLHVLAGADVGEALVVSAGDMREPAQLTGRQQAIRNGDAQHGRITLDVKAVLQAQGEKLILAELPGQVSTRLVAILRYPFIQQLLIVFLIDVHGTVSPSFCLKFNS